MRRFKEQLIRGILFICSTTSTLAVLLIVIFLFREGMSLFTKKAVTEETCILIRPDAQVKQLKTAQLRALFQGHTTNWKELGGADLPVKHFTVGELADAPQSPANDGESRQNDRMGDLIRRLTSGRDAAPPLQ